MTKFKIGDKCFALLVNIPDDYTLSIPTIDSFSLDEWTVLEVNDIPPLSYLKLKSSREYLLPRKALIKDCFKSKLKLKETLIKKIKDIYK